MNVGSKHPSAKTTAAGLTASARQLARVSAQQAKLSRVKERYKPWVKSLPVTCMRSRRCRLVATAGVVAAGVGMLSSGYDFAKTLNCGQCLVLKRNRRKWTR
ncbi:hypothetical protein KCP69_09200 [Salmonella enterica subsp. enterica]|nr:hypothetical protein KCP69_09200 [Salmonella enterica subsp. enterica]